MYSRQSETFLGQHAEARERLRATVAEIAAGEAWGARVADAILLARAADGSDEAAAYTSTRSRRPRRSRAPPSTTASPP
jgi:hypothetical protein